MEREVADQVIAANPEQVERWHRNEPGAWGFLASQAVLAYRQRLGRRIEEAERRRVWSTLWSALEEQR